MWFVQVLVACWRDSSSDSDDSSILVMKDEVKIPDTLFSLMADTENDNDIPMTLLGINENLKDYSLSKLRSLASLLLDSLVDLAKDEENMRKSLKNVRKKWWNWVCKWLSTLMRRKTEEWFGKIWWRNDRAKCASGWASSCLQDTFLWEWSFEQMTRWNYQVV